MTPLFWQNGLIVDPSKKRRLAAKEGYTYMQAPDEQHKKIINQFIIIIIIMLIINNNEPLELNGY